MLHEDEAGDAITGLQQKTHYGRPRWSEIFESISRNHPKWASFNLYLPTHAHTQAYMHNTHT